MLVIKDFATTILASALTAAATSVVVSDASRLPALSAGDYYYLVLQKFTDRTNVEVVKVTGATGNTLTVVRAQAGTTAKSFAIGDYAEQRVTVGTFSEYIAQSVADKVDKSGGHVEQSLGLLNTGDLVKATVGISYDATNGHGTILSGGEGANKATPYVALRPLGVADSSVQLKYAQDGSLILSGGSRYVETGLLSMRHPQDANGWPNATNNDANNYNNRARGKVHVNNNALYFIADGTFNARRFGIQSGHESPGYATAYGILDLNPFGGTVRVNGGTVYHTNYVPTPAAVGALALAGGTLTGALDQNMGGYGGRMLAAGGYAYLQGGKVGGDTADQKLRITGINLVPLTEFDILTAGHGVAKANGARIYTEQYVPTPSVLGVVPQARTINSKPLTSDITLSAADVGAVAAADNTYWRRRGLKTDLNTADNARPGYFSVTPTSVGMPIAGIYGHGLTVGPGDDAQYDVWYSQILFGHNNRIYTRNGVNGAAAGAWNYIFTSTDKPTAADVGALPITGGTLTGNLTAPAVLVSSAQNTSVNALTRKDYVDSAIAAGDALQVSKSGDTMTGDLTAPKVLVSGVQGAEDNALTRKDYVDSQVATRAPTAHTHTVANVDGLQTALDGKSATSHTHTAADVGALPVNANAVSATKLQTARTINGTDFDGSGNITTANWGTARTLTIGNSGKSVNGAGNVSWSLAEIGAARSAGEVSSGAAANISTATFVQWLESIGAFNDKSWTARCSWSYAANRTITDTGCGNIHLAGCTIEVISTSTSTYTIRVITPTTSSGGTTGAEFVYVNNGPDYAPGWRRIYTTSNKPTAADVGALPVQAAGGVLEVGKYIDFHDAGTNVDYSLRLMQEGTSLRVQGANGYVDVGAKNTGFAHYYTDRPQHYFDKDVNVNDLYVRSDVRLKSNLEPLSDALAKVCSLKGWTYDKKLALDSEAVYRRETGLIAQDVQKVLPSAVHAVEGGLLTLSSSALVALLVEAVKELSEKVKELEYGRT